MAKRGQRGRRPYWWYLADTQIVDSLKENLGLATTETRRLFFFLGGKRERTTNKVGERASVQINKTEEKESRLARGM